MFGPLVQGSPWVLERAFAQRPFADTIELRSALHDAVMSGDAGEQQHLLDSFADLGDEHEGRGTRTRSTTPAPAHSTTRPAPRSHELAVAYRERFGFPLSSAPATSATATRRC